MFGAMWHTTYLIAVAPWKVVKNVVATVNQEQEILIPLPTYTDMNARMTQLQQDQILMHQTHDALMKQINDNTSDIAARRMERRIDRSSIHSFPDNDLDNKKPHVPPPPSKEC